MEMELCAGEIQAYCTDILDGSLALIRSAMTVRELGFLNDLELMTYNQEQAETLNKIIDDVMCEFTNYYYAANENYIEHPYYMVTLVQGEELKDYHKNYFDKNPIFKVNSVKLSDTVTKTLFSVKDKNKYIQALDNYCLTYGCDEVFNDEENLLTCKAQNKQLYNLLTKKDYNLFNFVITDIKYIKALCYNEYKNKLSITDVNLDFDDDNNLVFKCTIADKGFVEGYEKDNLVEDVKTEIQKTIEFKPTNKNVTKLTDIEKHVISARAYLQEHSGKLRVSYKDIAKFLTNNDIYKITENNIKQKVISIYNKLYTQDLGIAVIMLSDANALIEYENVKI